MSLVYLFIALIQSLVFYRLFFLYQDFNAIIPTTSYLILLFSWLMTLGLFFSYLGKLPRIVTVIIVDLAIIPPLVLLAIGFLPQFFSWFILIPLRLIVGQNF